MKNFKTLAVGAVLASGTLVSGAAAAELSGNVGIASQYVFRGVVFGDPQVSGGIDWSDGGNLYAGTWISSAGGEQEADFYAGFANELFDLGYIYYAFPDQTGSADAQEVYAGVASGAFAAKVWYGFNGFNGIDDDEYLYVEANLDLPVSEKATLSLHLGMQENLGDAYDGDPETTFMDYAATLGFGDLYIMLSATDYDIGVQEENDPTITVGYSWSFDNL